MKRFCDTKRFGSASLTARFLLALLPLALAEVLIPPDVLTSLSTLARDVLSASLLWVVALWALLGTLPKGAVRPGAMVAMVVLSIPAVLGYHLVTLGLAAWFPRLTAQIDIWAWTALPLYALRPACLGLYLLTAFALVWRLTLGRRMAGRRTRRKAWQALLMRLGFILCMAAGCLTVSYLHMLNYAQIQMGTVFGTLFGQGPPQSAFWYRLGTIPNLLATWLAEPLELWLLGGFMGGSLRWIRRGYLAEQSPERAHAPANQAAMHAGAREYSPIA